MKRILIALAALLSLTATASASGTIPLSMTQQFDSQGKPLSGGMLYLIQAGTTATPQNAYQDSDLTIPLPNPIVLDAAGRVPQLFIADGQIKVRLTDRNGVTQLVADNVLVIGPSSGGGGGGGGQVDPTTIIQTGDVKYRYGTGSLSGFVRANGRTIGSASSGASERANADCQALFEYLWSADPTLVVSGGRGSSAVADWAANKTITLPDFRGRVLAGLDTMGASSAERLNLMSSTVLGGSGGSQSHALTAAELAPHTHSGTTGGMNRNNPHSHTGYVPNAKVFNYQPQEYAGLGLNYAGQQYSIIINATDINHEHPFTTNGGDGVLGVAHNITQPTSVVTIYLKL